MFENIPEEMKRYRQWVCWKYEDHESGKPTKVPYNPVTGNYASVTDERTWNEYETVISCFSSTGIYAGIGFVLSEKDPYTFIDLDDTKGDYVKIQKQMFIYNKIESYSEKSPSGNGLHIIAKGKVPTGRKRSAVEIYSSLRFMTMTGNVFRACEIKECNHLVNALWAEIGSGAQGAYVYGGDKIEHYRDDEVCNMAYSAKNGELFYRLYYGNWQDMYASQSEADFALIDIIAFYTQNRIQIERIFKSSSLGQRKKAQRKDYILSMINNSFDKIIPPIDIEGLQIKINEAIKYGQKKKELDTITEGIKYKQDKDLEDPKKEIYTVPPGLVGEIAKYIYAQAPRPVPEIALIGAFALVAGIAGRAYNVSNTGLNQYFLLLAPTGVGKEAIASGMESLISAVQTRVSNAERYMGPGEIASPQALTKHLANCSNSFVSLLGEFGLYLQAMCSTKAPPHLVNLRRLILDLYNKSGNNKVLRSSIYAEQSKNIPSILAPSVTFCGESTPEKFYEGLSENLIQEGLLPRFTVIEYLGDRPPLNETHNEAKISDSLLEGLLNLCTYCNKLNAENKVINVTEGVRASKILKDFDKYADRQINDNANEFTRQLWNRAHIKALKLAALLALGENLFNPKINEYAAKYAINIIKADIENIVNRFNNGEIGRANGENQQYQEVIRAAREYVLKSFTEVKSYCPGFEELHRQKIIPQMYFQRKLYLKACFKNDKMGATYAIKRTLKTMVENGELEEIPKLRMNREKGHSCLAYMIGVPAVFSI